MAQRATSLGPKPSLFVFFLFLGFLFFSLLSFLCFFNRQKNLFFPLEKGIFCLFSMFLFLSPLTFFGLPLFLFLFLCLSLALVFLTFLLVFLLCFLFVSCFCLFLNPYLSSLLLFHEKKNMKILNCNFCFPEIFSLSFGFLSCFSVSNPFFLSLLFPDLKLCFCSTSMFLVSKRTNWKAQKKQKKTKKNKLQQNGVFYEPVFCKMWKVIVFFLPLFLPIFGWCSKKHYKNRYFQQICKSKKNKKKCILRCYYLGQVGVIIWAKLTAS